LYTNKCIFNIFTNLTTKFLGRKSNSNSSNTLDLHANLLDLLYFIALRNPTTIPSQPNITIYNNAVLDIFTQNQAAQTLQLIAQNNSLHSQFTFYTDGSVNNITNNGCKMSIGWIQIQDETILHQYSAEIKLWPSSYKAELIAILSAITTCPKMSTITIYTDSQSIISKYNKLIQSPPTPNRQYSYNYWPIWHILLNFITAYQIQVHLQKVTAHSNNTFNNIADKLAKNPNQPHILTILHNNIYNPSYYLYYDKYPIEQPACRTIKNISNAYNIAMWSSQN
jgi:ribonuclease HI